MVFGKFEDLLIVVEIYVVMLIYFDQVIFVGFNLCVGQFCNWGINENFVCEILELYMVGVNGGYDQDDVEVLVCILIGWMVGL